MPEIFSNKQASNDAEGALQNLLHHAKIWRAGEVLNAEGIATGVPLLDGFLPNGGWPAASLTEILTDKEGSNGLSLVLPSVAQLSQTQWAIWICPPHVPYAPALYAAGVALERMLIIEPDEEQLADSEYMLWVFEQALRFPDCGIAMAWLGSVPHMRLRRLQLACEQGQTLGVMFRPKTYAIQPSPAVLRLSLELDTEGTNSIRILKAQGDVRSRICKLDL